jgi:ribose transport system substrate-binding protein
MNCRLYTILLTLTLTSLVMTVCAQSPGSAVPPTHSKTSFAFVTNNPSDYWIICRKGTEAAARKLGNVSVQFVMPGDGTAATQKRDIDDLLAAGVQGIAVSPVDPANETPYLNTVAAKTNLITSDSDAAQSDRLCYIGTDNRAAGVMAGRLIRQALPRGGPIMLFVGRSDAQNARERISGIRDALRGSRLRILGVRTDDADRARAKTNAADALARYPRLAGMVGIWSYNGPAIISAVKEAHKAGRVKIVAFDEETDTLAGVKDGTVSGAVVLQPYLFGYDSVRLLARLARGDRGGIPAGRRIIVPTLAIKRANVRAYEAQQARRLRGPG